MKSILIISMPFNIGVGGFIRSRNVLPCLAKELYEEGFQVDLFIPFNALLTAMKHYSAMYSDEAYEFSYLKIIEELRDIERESRYAINIDEKVVICGLNRVNEAMKRGILTAFMPEYLKLLAKVRMEKGFLEECVWNHKRQYPFIYSMHETVDALTALSLLVNNESKAAVLLQSDLGFGLTKLYSIKVLRKLAEKGVLRGFLAVSPQPVIETPELIQLVPKNKVKIIIPGNAVDQVVLSTGGPKNRLPGVVYFGRISREKGIFDLIKAWNIVERNCENAIMYVIGEFENSKLRDKVNRLVEKYRLKGIKFVGPLQREHLFKVVSRFNVLAYPSYRDSYALTVLESLALGLDVVAYDIPAIRYLYGQSHRVTLVPKGDYITLAKHIIRKLSMKDVLPRKDPITDHIIKLHSSWDTVARSEFKKLNELIK